MVFRLAIFALIFIATSGAWAAPVSENLAHAAQGNDPAALFQLALVRHTENKTTEAIDLHTRAASQGFQASMIWLRNNALQDGNTAEALLWAKQLVRLASLDAINAHLLPLLEPGNASIVARAHVLNAGTAYRQGNALLASRETMNDREAADQGAIAMAYLHYAAQEQKVGASQALANLFENGQENAFPWRDDGQAAYWNAAVTAPVKTLYERLASFLTAPKDWNASILGGRGCYYDAQTTVIHCSRCDGSFADYGSCKAHFPDCGIAATEPVAAPSQPPAPQNAAAACSPAQLPAGNAPAVSNPAMSSLQARVASFTGHEHPFTSKGITTLALAEAGLYYVGPGDRVRCYSSCKGILYNWNLGENPQAEHAKHFSTCAFVKCQAASAQCLAAAQLPAGSAPVDPAMMSSLQARIASFAGHEHLFTRKGINTLALAEAGLYCLKDKDHVCCYSCKKTLSNWMSTDNPQAEHARYFPDCALVKCKTASAQCLAAAQLPNTEMLSAGMQNLNIASAANASTPAADAELIDEIDEEQRLIAENAQLIEARTCKVCMDKEIDTVFLPCGHFSCQECAPKLRDCPACRTYIRGTVKSFFS